MDEEARKEPVAMKQAPENRPSLEALKPLEAPERAGALATIR